MSTEYAPGLHVVTGRAVDASAYDRWVGRWSRLFVPSLLAAARLSSGCTVLDAASGTGESAVTALSMVGSSGTVVGADIAPEMLETARVRLNTPVFRPVAADGHALPFRGDWEPIETGVGSQPQTYLALTEPDRQAVRETVKAKLARFESDGKPSMNIEMLIGSGRA